ncbi:MAG: quinoprotein dehydrogenase-associated putative ABC transporter substrate-binding protein [Ancylobacter novellus]|uniref:Quinoprotein dehydrogenase-associated putative ABC transporter substrate-binding protein n=1 Tax=Ancylobacter novellus TaxID=921 RepID=A0A2W5LWD2_ANCNO|nr:MAG: quinoprotein dehydrogenase-associated putative ABC transporter substrate-binding protein [Ancylobacter novellus]
MTKETIFLRSSARAPSRAATRPLAVLACAAALLSGGALPAAAQTSDLVNRVTLRVCADPADMPLSNEKGEGYENKIAELLSKDLGIPLTYTWFPQATGFYRMTLGIKRCDVVLGVTQGADPYLNTNAFVRTTSMLVTKKGGGLDGVEALSDPKLQGKKIGVTAGTPAASHLIRYGLMAKAKPYPLTVDRRYESPVTDMLKDVESGVIDAAVVWGPLAGYYVRQSADLASVPLVKEKGQPPMIYRLTFGVRPGEDNWKHRLNDFIAKHQKEIDQILSDYGVPLVDEQDNVRQASK